MKILDIGGIPTSLGEIINFKFHLDLIKDGYDQIKLGFTTSLWDTCLHTEHEDWDRKRKLWVKFLDDIGNLFFSEAPYILENSPSKWAGSIDVVASNLQITPQKVELSHLLCKGISLPINEEYIVITTKVREVERSAFSLVSSQLWDTLKQLSQKYKIVVLGERLVEIRKEYEDNHSQRGAAMPFGIYEDIVSNVVKENLIDLTVPALGETVSDLSQIQQDCLLMKEAKFVITIGVGGNFCLATSTANMVIGFRGDNIPFGDIIFSGREYPNAIITKDWPYFIQKLQGYL